MGFKFTTLPWKLIQKILTYFDTAVSYIKTSVKIETTSIEPDSIKTAGDIVAKNIKTTGRCISNITTDGNDSSRLLLNGGGGEGSTRGAQIGLAGNEDAIIPGAVYIDGGAIAGGGAIVLRPHTGATVSTTGKFQVDDTTEATTTTDGSLQTDGGLSVAKNAVVGGYNIARAFYSQKDINMTDDGVSSILLSNSITGTTIGSMFMDIAIRGTFGGTQARFARIAFYLVAGSTEYAVVISDNGNLGSGVKVLTNDVTGTTGDDGYLTVACYTGTSPNSWSIKLENRLGETAEASIMFSCINN